MRSFPIRPFLLAFAFLFAFVFFVSGCSEKTEEEKDACLEVGASSAICDEIRKVNPGASDSLVQCLGYLAQSKPKEARDAVASSSGAKETYCSVLASFQDLLIQLGPLLDTVSSVIGNGAPGYTPTLDAGAILQSALKNILPRLDQIREGALKIANKEDVKLSVPSLPLKIKVASLQNILGGSSDLKIPSDLQLDLKGDYDRSHLLILGIIGSGVPALVSFLSAHDLNIDLSIIDIVGNLNNLGGLATNLVDKQSTLLLLKDGNTVKTKVKELLLNTLYFSAGKPGANAPGDDGLLAQIKRELKRENDLTGKEVVAYIDKNGNGQFDRDDTLRITFVNDLLKQLGVTDQTGDFDNFLPEEGWQGLTNIGQDLYANLNGGDPVKPLSRLHRWLQKENELNPDLFNSKNNPNGTPYGPIPLPPDWIAVNLKAYFDNPKGLRETVFPAIFDLGTTPPSGYSRYDFAFECELAYTAEEFANLGSSPILPADSLWRLLCGAGYKGKAGQGMFLKRILFRAPDESTASTNITTADGDHFSGLVNSPATNPAEFTNPTTIAISFASSDRYSGTLLITNDGIGPEYNKEGADGILYIVFKDPTLGGILLADSSPNPSPSSPGGNPTNPATLQSLNTIIAKFQKYYLKYIVLLLNSL